MAVTAEDMMSTMHSVKTTLNLPMVLFFPIRFFICISPIVPILLYNIKGGSVYNVYALTEEGCSSKKRMIHQERMPEKREKPIRVQTTLYTVMI